ncbi:MAG: hypothetical protein IKU07_02710 [Oscillospiraceae bacterium]|nr:hypothetical protein [Oscillospiraceae bacterium]
MAYGGVMAALAVVIMCLGTLIPLATFICPVLCCLIGATVLRLCGSRVSWAWYAALCILSLLLAPDKEAAVVYVMLGAYPMLKTFFDRLPGSVFFKLLYFNASAAVLYTLLMRLLGLSAVLSEYGELGIAGFLIMTVAANVTFLLLDVLLKRISVRRKSK